MFSTQRITSKYYVPAPFLFSSLKHHAGYVAEFIRTFRNREEPAGRKTGLPGPKNPDAVYESGSALNLMEDLIVIGNSQMDFYTGYLSPEQIAREMTGYFRRLNILGEKEYLQWISSAGSSYRATTLSDGSVWVLLPGKIPGRHIHIHPGRYSRCTVRVRSETLKSAIAVLCYCNNCDRKQINLDMINKARTSLLGLSPVKEVHPDRGLGKMLDLLLQKLHSG